MWCLPVAPRNKKVIFWLNLSFMSPLVLLGARVILLVLSCSSSFEPRHDKTNKMSVHPAKTQISLGICPAWSESSLSAWVFSYPLSAQRRLWSDRVDAQADLSLRWVHSHFVGFVRRRLIFGAQMRVFEPFHSACSFGLPIYYFKFEVLSSKGKLLIQSCNKTF